MSEDECTESTEKCGNFVDECTQSTVKCGIFVDECTESTGIFAMSALKALENNGFA